MASQITTETAALHPSAPTSDLDASWLTRSVDLVGWSVICGLAAAAVRDPIVGVAPTHPADIVIGIAVLVAGGALWLNRRGRARQAGQILAFGLPILATGLALATGRGFRDPAILIMPASLIVCGVLLDRTTLAKATGLTVAATTGVLLAEARGIVAGSGDPRTLSGDVLDSVVILAITGIGVGIVASRLRRGIERLRRQEAALRASEERYRGLVDLAADAIVLGSRTEGIVEANRRASELTGYSRKELLGRGRRPSAAPSRPGSGSRRRWRQWDGSQAESPTTSTTSSPPSPAA